MTLPQRFSGLLLVLAVMASSLFAAVPANPALEADVAAAAALQQSGKVAEARAAYAKILEYAPDHPGANCQVALSACNEGQWEKALRHAAKALASDSHNAQFQYTWGAANGVSALKSGVFSKFGYAKKCLAAYQRAVELEPANTMYRWALVNYYQQAPGFVGGGLDKAYGQAEEIRKLDADRGRQVYAQLYIGEKKFDQAFQLYDEALQAHPDDRGALYQFGRISLISGQRLDDGLAAFRRCLETAPTDQAGAVARADLHCRIGGVFEKQGRPTDARAEYAAALQEQPEFRPAKQALAKMDARKT